MEINVWLVFVLASILFSIAPGAGVISSINNSLNGGLKAAFRGIIGLQLALTAHLIIVSLGLGALLASSALFFKFLKYTGAAYLLYLGIQKFYNPLSLVDDNKDNLLDSGKLIKQGFIVNLMNPKSIVFLSAFLPQFLTTNTPLTIQYLILGATVLVIDGIVMISYSFLASLIKPYLTSKKIMTRVNNIFGSLFIFMGIMLAKAER